MNKIRREIRFRILCSIGNPKIQILRSKSRFPNRTHPKKCISDVLFINLARNFNLVVGLCFSCCIYCLIAV